MTVSDQLKQMHELLLGLQRQLKEKDDGDYFMRIVHSNPKFYSGEEDPIILFDWIQDFDKLFDALNYPVERRVNAAVYYMKGEADIWWTANKDTLQAKPDFSWDDLKVALKNHFYPEQMMWQKYTEYRDFEQLSMSVKEYYVKFMQLARLAADMIPNEDYKVQKFVRGLNCSIRVRLCTLRIPTIEEAYEKAYNLYLLELQGEREEIQARKRKVNFKKNTRYGR